MEETALPDGRRAQLWTGGAAHGPAVVVCHGTPDSRWVARTGRAAAEAAGVRLVCVNRPGYGTSAPSASTMTSVADDTVAVLDRLGVERVAALGMSVGGPYAAALATRHPDRVVALALVAAPAEDRSMTGSAEDIIEATRPEFATWAASIDPTDSDDAALAARWLGSLPAADGAVLGSLLSTHELAASAREALSCHEGYLRDAGLLLSGWEFSPSAVGCPTHLWYGEEDERNPPVVGQWWADRMPQAELTVTPTSHLATLLANWTPILTALLRLTGP